jgi:hypothetical protein
MKYSPEIFARVVIVVAGDVESTALNVTIVAVTFLLLYDIGIDGRTSKACVGAPGVGTCG